MFPARKEAGAAKGNPTVWTWLARFIAVFLGVVFVGFVWRAATGEYSTADEYFPELIFTGGGAALAYWCGERARK